MRKRILTAFVLIALVIGCAGLKTSQDQAIQYRQQFNLLLAQWNNELMSLPEAQKIDWAKKSTPIVQAGIASLDLIDIAANSGGQITPEMLQKFMEAKNKLIDLIANLILVKKGGK